MAKRLISEQLRDAVRRSGYSQTELGAIARIPQPTVTRFVNGADMKLSTIDRLCRALGLELTRTDVSKRQMT